MIKRLIVCTSGEIGTGKSTLAKKLRDKFDFEIFKTSGVLGTLSRKRDRVSLQKLGEKLDVETDGAWVRDNFHKHTFSRYGNHSFFVVDSITIYGQFKHLRKSYGYSVKHVHLEASSETLLERYVRRKSSTGDKKSIEAEYARVKSNKTEKQVNSSLCKKADLVVNTENSTEEDVLVRVAGALGILAPLDEPLADVVVGGQFGSEGKGQVCGYLAPEYDALVRVGGPNAGHTVYAIPEPAVFHLLPSGTNRAADAKLIIGPGAVLNLKTLKDEIERFRIETGRLVIDHNATVITVADVKREEGLRKSIGSTGQGVGYAAANNILNRGSSAKNKVENYEKELKGFVGSAHEELEAIFRRGGRVLLEGTQGTGLSLHHGFYPYVTSRDTSVCGCLAEAGIAPQRLRRIILVVRTYPIRVENPEDGSSGPFLSNELSWDIVSKRCRIPKNDLEKAEKTSTTNRKRRVAEFNWALFRKACELNSPTDIALTFADYFSVDNQDARRVEQLTPETIDFVEELERCAGVTVSLISTRFGFRSIIDRRAWKRI